MLTLFRAGSIRRQIAALAITPVIVLSILGGLAEVLLDNFESVSAATASKVELVIDQMRASRSPEQEAAILDAASRTGLQVEEVSAAELAQDAETTIPLYDTRHLIQESLQETFVTTLRPETDRGTLHNVLVVGIGDGRALAFLPARASPHTWISEPEVDRTLVVLVFFLPMTLLSLYAAHMIATPLLEFAKAAEKLNPDEGPDRPFDEGGAFEIRTLARSLNEMRSRVRSMIDDRTRMLRAISHDLRTPLTRLRLRAERSTQPELKAALLNDISALNDMINDTLTYLSKDMATENPVNADLPSLLATVCSDFSDVGFNVRYAGPDRFAYRCKPRSLARAITNLVDNSTKHAQKISVDLSLLQEGAVRICVMDDGRGIPGSLHTRVLEPFFKVDTARTSDRSGFGLGLSIVDDIVRAHGGTIELFNRKPHGLTAQMDFPAGGYSRDTASGQALSKFEFKHTA